MTVHGMHREASIEINTSPEAVYDLVSERHTTRSWKSHTRKLVMDRWVR